MPQPDHVEYTLGELNEANLEASPFAQLSKWLAEATEAGAIEPRAMCLATADAEGRPSARFVLVREIEERGVTFYTNFTSRKGQQIDENPFAAATFWWGILQRQVRIEGRTEKCSDQESDYYFSSRPHLSKIAAVASPQSEVVASREELASRFESVATKYPDNVPRPASCGGYRIVPERYEFWQGRSARLHDRLVYVATKGGWRVERLAP